MTRTHILSASQISIFNSCRRKWAYQYIDNIKPPSSKAAVFESTEQKTLENYLIKNLINYQTNEGRLADAGPICFAKIKNDFFENIGSQTWKYEVDYV